MVNSSGQPHLPTKVLSGFRRGLHPRLWSSHSSARALAGGHPYLNKEATVSMLSSLALRLKALSPFHIVVLAIVALAVLGSSTAVASKLITGADVKDRSLTGRDIARGSVSHSNLKDDSVTSRDIKDGTVHSIDLSPGVRAQLAKSGAGGVVGKDGAKGENGDTGPQGAKGDAGAQGPKGDVGAAGGGAAGGFVIKDADGTTAGPMLTPASQFTSQKGSFYYTGHIFDVDFRSGDLQFATMGFYYTTADCTGTPYTTVNYAQSVVKSANPSDAGNLYEFGEIGTVDVKSSMGSGFGPATCTTWPAGNGDNFSGLARMNVLSAGDTPPGLHGPMRIVPAS